MAPPKIFISYSRKDHDITQRLVNDLHTAGAEVWVDVDGIQSGNFMQAIDAALAKCEWMLLVLSPSAIGSEYVSEETYTALHRVKQGYIRAVIPVLVSPCAPGSIPPQWDVLQRYDATLDYSAALVGVLRTVGLAPSASAPSPVLPVQPTILPDHFPKRLADLGYQARTDRDFAYILPPLVSVPAGPFLMGTDPKRERVPKDIRPEMKAAWFALIKGEQPQHRVNLPAFEIARCPVTVAEYACFVRVGHPEPLEWHKQLPRLDHPVCHVSWYDAAAYAGWLAGRTGDAWRLPTEAEWEKAARGTDGRVYPWGDTFERARCNCSESGIYATTPVGSYPSGASPYGVLDMAGNVCEWTTSLLLPYPYTVSDEQVNAASPQNRVTRGGNGYTGNSIDLRGAYRTSCSPDLGSGFGFRLVRAAPTP